MSEADTPKSSPSSGNDYDAIDELIAFADQTDESESLDELIASLDDSTSQTNDSDSNLDDLLFNQEPVQATDDAGLPDQPQQGNQELLHRNAELQKALAVAQAELEQQQLRLRQAEDLNAQQNDEINAASEQNLSLSQELKNYRLQEQQQVEKISQLTHQLQVSQQRVAQLERECALIQKQFQEQSYKLCQAEKYSRELSFRLQQQRRHTWQFKSALNKCLETNADKEEHEVIPNASVSSQPIPAWSSQKSNGSVTTDQHSEQESSLEEKAASQSEMMDFSRAEYSVYANQTPSEAFTAEAWQSECEAMTKAEEMSAGYAPAPLLASSRKKRQSYAAVELPKFIR